MKNFLLLIFLLFVKWANSQDLSTDLQSIYKNHDLMGLSVWVFQNEAEYQFAYGLRDFDRNLPVENTTKFRIASISKGFTALGIMLLYDQGAFELDEDISSDLGFLIRNPEFPDKPITYRMLLSHQSGLQDGTGYFDFLYDTYETTPIPELSELLDPTGSYYTADIWLPQEPGSYFNYSNINFGILGTLIERLSGERFDRYLKNHILEPMGITGSFNIQDIPDINNLAVLYRFQGGAWIPQTDNFQGVFPEPPNLTNYVIGSNGLYFAPQGGLRVSATETGKLVKWLLGNGTLGNLTISEETLNIMKATAWEYTPGNGNNYFGLFNKWGLGLHLANGVQDDQICQLGVYGTFIGHPGEAYGLISDAYASRQENVGFAFLINGKQSGYTVGNSSAFYEVEEAIFQTICNFFQNPLSIEKNSKKPITLYPVPASNSLFYTLDQQYESVTFSMKSMDGRELFHTQEKNVQNGTLEFTGISPGTYLLKVCLENKFYIEKFILE